MMNIYLAVVPYQAQSSQKPWNFLSDENDKGVSCYVNEVSFAPSAKNGGGLSGEPGM